MKRICVPRSGAAIISANLGALQISSNESYNDVRRLVVRCGMKDVSKLPDRNDRQCRWNRCNGRRVSANNRDDLIAVHLKSRMETNNNVVGEHALWILLRSASLQRKLDLVAEITFANNLTRTVAIEVRVGDAIKLLVKFQIHLKTGERNDSVTFLRKKETTLKSVVVTPRVTPTLVTNTSKKLASLIM